MGSDAVQKDIEKNVGVDQEKKTSSNLITTKLSGLSLIFILLIGLCILFICLFKNKSNNACEVLPSPVPVANKSGNKSKVSLDIPIEENWVKYDAKCSELKDNLTIYYPSDWKPSLIAESGVSDGSDDPNIDIGCRTSFGYPIQIMGPQDPWLPGLYGYIEVGSRKSSFKSLNEMFTGILYSRSSRSNQDVAVYMTNIANKKWVKEDFKWSMGRGYSLDQSLDHYIQLTTLFKGREYSVVYSVFEENKLDATSSARLLDIGEEFVNKLQFH